MHVNVHSYVYTHIGADADDDNNDDDDDDDNTGGDDDANSDDDDDVDDGDDDSGAGDDDDDADEEDIADGFGPWAMEPFHQRLEIPLHQHQNLRQVRSSLRVCVCEPPWWTLPVPPFDEETLHHKCVVPAL